MRTILPGLRNVAFTFLVLPERSCAEFKRKADNAVGYRRKDKDNAFAGCEIHMNVRGFRAASIAELTREADRRHIRFFTYI